MFNAVQKQFKNDKLSFHGGSVRFSWALVVLVGRARLAISPCF